METTHAHQLWYKIVQFYFRTCDHLRFCFYPHAQLIIAPHCGVFCFLDFLIMSGIVVGDVKGGVAMNEIERRGEGEKKLRKLYCDILIRLGVQGPHAQDSYERLAKRYRENHRRYHTLEHLVHCFTELARVAMHVRNPDAVVLAIFYHDVVYNTARRDNEEQSAKHWLFHAQEVLEMTSQTLIKEVARLIILTKHHRTDPVTDKDGALFLDIDMSILSADAETYDAYADAVRAEYASLSDDDWAIARVAMLIDPILSEERIFLSPHFGKEYDERARANLMEERVRYQKN